MANTRSAPSGKTSQGRSVQETRGGVTFAPCLRRSQKPKFRFLFPETWQTPEWCEAMELISLGSSKTPNITEYPRDAAESFLSQVLEPDAPTRYCLSRKACEGILRRAAKRGKELPPMLKEALEAQCLEMAAAM